MCDFLLEILLMKLGYIICPYHSSSLLCSSATMQLFLHHVLKHLYLLLLHVSENNSHVTCMHFWHEFVVHIMFLLLYTCGYFQKVLILYLFRFPSHQSTSLTTTLTGSWKFLCGLVAIKIFPEHLPSFALSSLTSSKPRYSWSYSYCAHLFQISLLCSRPQEMW